jgi:hypothetical protein
VVYAPARTQEKKDSSCFLSPLPSSVTSTVEDSTEAEFFESFCVRAFNLLPEVLSPEVDLRPCPSMHTLWRMHVCTSFQLESMCSISNSCLHTCGIHTRQADLCLYRASPHPISRQEALRSQRFSLGPGGRVLLLEWELRQDMQKVDDHAGGNFSQSSSSMHGGVKCTPL